ncbi:hypothetical protein C3V39_08360 [Prevotella sp. oral taxon 820]|nr:hypothetical protein C3V39_08360 [Prevotella sp. oral taxon 820]
MLLTHKNIDFSAQSIAITRSSLRFHLTKAALLRCKRAALTRKKQTSTLLIMHKLLVINAITKPQNPCVFSGKDSFREK